MNATSLLCRPRLQRLLALGAVMLALAPVASAQVQLPGSDYVYPVRVLRPDAPATARKGKVRPADPAAAIKHKLNSIIFPKLEFKGVTVREAIEQIRQEAARLDTDPNPDTRGVNVFLKLPPTPPPNVNSPAAPPAERVRIISTLMQLPLLEALRYVSMQAGMRIDVEPDGVAIVPLTYIIEDLITTDYKVPLVSVGLLADLDKRVPEDTTSPGATIRRIDVAPWLASKGVDFPQGAVACYLPASGKLVVRNTQENLDKITTLISPALKIPAPTPANP